MSGVSEGHAAQPTDLAGWLHHLEALHPKGQGGIVLGLERMARVRDALGQVPWCPIITVGGTNGKGSVCAYLSRILQGAGYRVGCYTSPHLLHYGERVRVNGVPAGDAQLCDAFARVEAARQSLADAEGQVPVPLTYFEFGTLAAWEVFAAARVDVLVLEVGLGGRLDAVNAYDADVAVVTGVALDHLDWLGPDRESIGFEKAGIFRPGRPALCGDPHPPESLVRHAEAIGTPLHRLGQEFGYQTLAEERSQWRYWGRNPQDGTLIKRGGLAFPGLRGRTQLRNASVALHVLDCLRDRLPVAMGAVRQGLLETELAGRFQVLPGVPQIILDVAHNPEAAQVLASNLTDLPFAPRTLAVVGMLEDKDITGTLTALAGRVDAWFLADLAVPRGARAERLAELLTAAGVAGSQARFTDPVAAFTAAREAASDNDRMIVFGSFYTVAAALRHLGKAA